MTLRRRDIEIISFYVWLLPLPRPALDVWLRTLSGSACDHQLPGYLTCPERCDNGHREDPSRGLLVPKRWSAPASCDLHREYKKLPLFCSSPKLCLFSVKRIFVSSASASSP